MYWSCYHCNQIVPSCAKYKIQHRNITEPDVEVSARITITDDASLSSWFLRAPRCPCRWTGSRGLRAPAPSPSPIRPRPSCCTTAQSRQMTTMTTTNPAPQRQRAPPLTTHPGPRGQPPLMHDPLQTSYDQSEAPLISVSALSLAQLLLIAHHNGSYYWALSRPPLRSLNTLYSQIMLMRKDVIIFLCNHFLCFSESSQGLEMFIWSYIFTLPHIQYSVRAQATQSGGDECFREILLFICTAPLCHIYIYTANYTVLITLYFTNKCPVQPCRYQWAILQVDQVSLIKPHQKPCLNQQQAMKL